MINENILQLTGKATVPMEMPAGDAYTVHLTGEVVSQTKVPNGDGTYNLISKFRPIIAEIKNSHGETARTKDLRNNSIKFRKSCWKVWSQLDTDSSFDQFYDWMTSKTIGLMDKLSEDYAKKN